MNDVTRWDIDDVQNIEAHESAVKHVTGRAQYVDDIPEWPDQLHVATGKSVHAHARIVNLDLSAVWKCEDVIDVITYDDIPGDGDVGTVYEGDPLLATKIVQFVGQPLFAVAATSLAAAKYAVEQVIVEYEVLEAVLTPQAAMDASYFVLPEKSLVRGDADAAIAASPFRIKGEQYIRGQEHFYLEGQVSLCIPNEDDGVHVISSSQHPTDVQKLVAKVLAVPIHQVQVEVRRMGGGFGGKESQAAPLACMAAIFARRTMRPVKFRMPRSDDMVQTGKRHDFWNRYEAGFDDKGRILGVTMDLAAMCGYSPDLSEGIVDRAMFHADNSYYYDATRITGYRCKTHTVSNTAFRGFGGPKGMIAAEAMLDDIAIKLDLDPLDVRLVNLYREGRAVTPYGQSIEQHVLQRLVSRLEQTCHYRQRRDEIKEFNKGGSHFRKGLALTPVKFGISFTAKHLNQAGALVHVYTDGSIHVNHGGTEMGQGLYTKVAQVAARAMGVSLARIQVSATRTDKVPNTSPTAASAGSDLNGMAVLDAMTQIRERLITFAAGHFDCSTEEVSIGDDVVRIKDETHGFAEIVKLAYMNRVHLSAAGFYKTPKISFDFDSATGRPFFYFANGAATAEVIIDIRTGEYRVTRVDILHDVGQSLNPAIDIGQIEGGFVQGMGWLTTEELLWDGEGRLISDSPANYKIPTAYDVPRIFNVDLYDEANREETIYRSKAVGEPPLMLALSVWCALRDACASVADHRFSPPMNAPATFEEVYRCITLAKDFVEAVDD
ncbi:MAG: xanthine dehydrogenase molybdopterin binding subunit [Proteobacteria bacterium]|nr:xanthine dehydrogenase molybdopterin binding subunit [Pseudomonadota bacterium]